MNDDHLGIDKPNGPMETMGQPVGSFIETAGQPSRSDHPSDDPGRATENNLPTLVLADDMLYGADAIADYLGMRRRRVYHAVEQGHIPVLRIGQLICARKSRLLKWIGEMEAKAFGSR